MDGRRTDAGLLKTAAAGVGAVLGAHEHDGALRPLFFEERGQERVLGLDRDGQNKLVDRIGGARGRGDLNARRVVHQVGHLAHGLLVERGREEERLALLGGLAHDLAHGRQKAHVEHAVGLVKHEHAHLVEMAGALLDQIHQAARRGHEDVAAALERALLGVVAHAAHNGHGNMARYLRDFTRDLVDLLGELARGGDDQHERAATVAGGGARTAAVAATGALFARHGLGRRHVLEAVHGREQEGGRLAGSRLGGGEQVVAREHLGDGMGLHRGGRGVAEVLDGLEELIRKTELVKARERLLGSLHGAGRGGLIGCVEGGLVQGLGNLSRDLGVDDVGRDVTHMYLFPYLARALKRGASGPAVPRMHVVRLIQKVRTEGRCSARWRITGQQGCASSMRSRSRNGADRRRAVYPPAPVPHANHRRKGAQASGHSARAVQAAPLPLRQNGRTPMTRASRPATHGK